VCPTGPTDVRGVDVSIWQGTIDWPAAARGGVRFAMIRQSHATTTDTNFVRNWNGARAAGILRGAYQYFSPWADPTAQANAIVDALVAGEFGPGDLPPMIDVEQPQGAGDPPLPTVTEYATRVRTWVGVIRRRLGVEPIVYTGGYYWDAQVRTNEFAALPLWHPQYFNYPGTIYNMSVMPLPGGGCPTSVSNAWPTWVFWQFAGGNGRAPGFSGAVDVSVFNGTMAQLRALARVPAPDAGIPDSGSVTDGATDGSTRPDAVPGDGGAPSDASAADDGVQADDGTPALDGSASDASASGDSTSRDGARGDGGTAMNMRGCACRTGARTQGTAGATLLVLATVGVVSASRRRQRRAPRRTPQANATPARRAVRGSAPSDTRSSSQTRARS